MGGIYNPAGTEAARALGEDFPEGRYDNNTIASTLIGGWIDPALCAIALAILRRFHRKIKSIATEVASTKA